MDTYEEKCKEIVGQIRKAYLYAQTDSTKAVLEEIFPELKENEDEKILVIIKHCIECRYRKTSTIQGISMEQCFAWLERQGEHANFRNKIQVGDKVTRNEAGVLVNLSQLKRVARPSEKQGEQNFEMKTAEESLGIDSDTYNKIVDECIFGEQKPVDKVEPEFKIGEWIVDKSGFVQQVLDFRGGIYTCTYNSFTIGCESNYHHWTIKDAKDGDVLKEDSCIFILEKIKSQDTAIPHCCLFDDGNFNLSSKICFDVDSTYPATKEQRDTLIKAMADAGYTFDFERKELKRIVQKPEENKGNVGGISPNWSEEDEKYIKDLFDYFTGGLSLKHAEEDIVDWLKSLRPQNRWKPTDEQMGLLQAIINETNNAASESCQIVLKNILEQLKKLRG